MSQENDERLTGDEVLLLLDALEAYLQIPEDGGHLSKLPTEERERLAPYVSLRRRLKTQIGMSFFDRPGRWLELELLRERIAFGDRLFGRLADLLKDPKATRRTVREGFSAAYRELRESRQSTPRPGVW